MDFSDNILINLQSWNFTNAQLNGSTVIIQPNGYISCTIYPSNSDNAKLKEYYNVIVNQVNTTGSVKFTMVNHITGDDEVNNLATTVYGDNINKIVKLPQYNTRQTVVTLKNTSDKDVVISNIELRPKSTVSEDLSNELQRYVTHIVKYTNFDVINISTEKQIIANLNVELMERSNLLLHLLINGITTASSTLTLYITINNNEIEYSPLTVDVNNGNFIVGIPGNIMNIPEGESRIKIYAELSEGNASIQAKRLQVTLDGQNMVVIYGEDIWFGPSEDNDFDPCENEVFTYNSDLVEITGGRLKCKYIEGYIGPMNLKAECTFGNVYSFNFSEPNISKYENIEIT